MMVPYTQKRSRSRSLSPRRPRGEEDMMDRGSMRSAKYREHEKVHRSMKGYSRSRSPSVGRMKKYRSSKYDDKWASRSRSPSPYKRRMSRSRSRSYDRYSREREFYSYYYKKNRSRSPHSNRHRHLGNRDNPKPNLCLGVFGLSVSTTENHLYNIFSKYGPVKKVTIVIDAKVSWKFFALFLGQNLSGPC